MKKLIQDVIYEALTKLNITYSEDIVILEPKKKENGDFSTNIALKLAGILKEDAISIADKICQNISNDHFSKVEVVKPGFINFFVSKSYLLKNINIVLKEGKDYGRNNLGLGKKYNIEFVSANPTGILHLGNARGGAYGDSLARILRFSGYDVTEEYYINDAGNQVDNLALSIIARYKNICGIQAEIPENGYHGEEIITIAKNLYDEYSDTLLDKDLEYFKNLQNKKEHIIASLICTYSKTGAWSLYIGNDHTAEITGTINRLYYEFIKDAYENKYDYADLFGTVGDPKTKFKNLAGIFEHKRMLGGEYIEFIGEFDLINKPIWYKILPILLKIYRKVKK